MKRAIVLGGGGAKGSYQIGVWKALRKLKIKYNIVTGTSVGALNGVFFVQNDYFKAKKLWKKMDFELIFDKADLEKFNNIKNSKDLILMFGNNFLKQGGMNIENLENLAKINFNARKFFNSKKDFGIITFNATKLKPCTLKKENLTKDNLRDYVIASASCFPFFKMKKIDKEKYIDGGLIDNIPINLAIELGAEEIIAIDLKAPGIVQEVPKKYQKHITYIKPHNDIGHFLNFNKEQAKRNIKFGYNDTLKVFNKLEGIHYTFKKKELAKLTNKYKQEFINLLEQTLNNNKKKTNNIIDKIIIDLCEKRVFGIIEKDINKLFVESIEYLAKCLNVEETKIYRYKNFNKTIKKNFKKIKNQVNIENIETADFNDFENSKKIIIKFNQLLLENNTTAINNLAITYPRELLATIYLHIISR